MIRLWVRRSGNIIRGNDCYNIGDVYVSVMVSSVVGGKWMVQQIIRRVSLNSTRREHWVDVTMTQVTLREIEHCLCCKRDCIGLVWLRMCLFVIVISDLRCLRRKAIPHRAPLVNLTNTQPLEMICVAFLSLNPSKGGIENILVVKDHFTRYSQDIPTRNQTAKTRARVLFENYTIHYGFPASIHSDQGRNFESSTIKNICDPAEVRRSHTTPYNSNSNGQVERFNDTLLDMLGKLDPAEKEGWKTLVTGLVTLVWRGRTRLRTGPLTRRGLHCPCSA